MPLPDLGAGNYQGFAGGLYPNGSDILPASHGDAGVAAASQIKPLDFTGAYDNRFGKIVLVSIGNSDTTAEFASGGIAAFKPRADDDPSKSPQLTIVDGAQDGKDAAAWANPNDSAWATLTSRLESAGVRSAQVQAVWMNVALDYPSSYGVFPGAAQTLQADLEIILRMVKSRYPSVQIVYLSSRTPVLYQ